MQEVEVRVYFAESVPQIPGVTARAANAIIRGGIDTMEKLCGKSEEDLKKIRNLGSKSLEFTLAMRKKYAEEKTNIIRGKIK